MRDGLHALSQIPAPSRSNSRFYRQAREFFEKVAWKGFCLLVRGEQINKPRRNARWSGNRGGWDHAWLPARPRPRIILRRARCVRLTANIPLAVIRKKRFDRPPRSGVGSPNCDLT